MAAVSVLQPDRQFIEELARSGGGDLKQCFQCATCSAVCDLSNGKSPFPRREMHWAQWGLKERLIADPNVWLCHQCNDCSTHCPRGARPGDVLAAVRQVAVRHYSVPRFLASWANSGKYLPLVLLLPLALILGTLALRDPLGNALGFGEEHAFYAEFFPHWLLIGFYGFFTGLAFLAAVLGVLRFWSAMKTADVAAGAYAPERGLWASIGRTVKSIVQHDRFGRCRTQGSRRVAHLTAFYGFLALYVVTLWAVADLYVNPSLGIASMYPFGLLHPMKILANVGGVLLVFGCGWAIADRLRGGPGAAASTAFDWIFVWLLLGVGVTGFATEVLRFAVDPGASAGLETTAHVVYVIHLVLVFQLLVYLPYSKFAHVLYRTVAIVYAEHTGRRPRLAALTAARAVPARRGEVTGGG
jgi:quinone-modifying oxidoreductase subunit QmoC